MDGSDTTQSQDANPVLKAVDDALDVIEKFIEGKKDPVKKVGLGLMATLRAFLHVPDDIGGDAD